jgi:hypothetical protein
MKSWQLGNTRSFAYKVRTEVWILEKFFDDVGEVEGALTPDYYRQLSRTTRRKLTLETAKLVTYLLPWATVMSFKVLEVIRESCHGRLPRTFIQNPSLHRCCIHLLEVMRRPRNKIMHVGDYGLYRLHYHENNRVRWDEFFVVRDEKRRQVLKIEFYDLLFIVVFVLSIAKALRRNLRNGINIELATEQVKALASDGWIPRDLLQNGRREEE